MKKHFAPGYQPTPTRPNWEGTETPIQRPPGSILAADPRGPVELIRRSRGRYAVVYGLQVNDMMDWQEASRVYGKSIFHMLECEGLIVRN